MSEAIKQKTFYKKTYRTPTDQEKIICIAKMRRCRQLNAREQDTLEKMEEWYNHVVKLPYLYFPNLKEHEHQRPGRQGEISDFNDWLTEDLNDNDEQSGKPRSEHYINNKTGEKIMFNYEDITNMLRSGEAVMIL